MSKQANRQWVWIAMGAHTRQVLACHVGDRSGQSAQALWEKIPAGDQEQAVFYTDPSAASVGALPSAQPRAIARLARKTPHVERFHGTFRQQGSRLARATLLFSKNLAHHLGALRYFVCHNNLTKYAA